MLRSCTRCELALRSSRDFGMAGRLTRCAAVRESCTLHDRCPDCCTRLVRVVLEWGDVARVTVEECSYCALLLVDRAEHARLAEIVRACRALDERMVERLVERAPEPDEDALEPPPGWMLWTRLRWAG